VHRLDGRAEHCPPLPDNHDIPVDEPEAINSLISLRGFRKKARSQWGEREWRLHRWSYHRLTERVDGQIGIVLDALEKSGQLEKTVIFFTSDHGDHSSSHRLEHKTVFYEEAVRVPLIVAHPFQCPDQIVNNEHVVNTGLDLMATCLDYAGAVQPEFNKGISLRTIVEGQNSTLASGAYSESQIGYMWTTAAYKYCLYDACGEEEVLYDLNDPGETRNCAQDPEKAHILKTLRDNLNTQRRIHSELSLT
jgi:arylsulfatase A-like enzyme